DFLAFPNLASTLLTNIYRLSGVDPQKPSSKQLLSPLTYDGDPTDFLYDTPFWELFTTYVPFSIKRERFNEHGCLFARSGHGKTRALRSFIAQFLQEPDPPALFIMDSLGSLIDGLDQLEVFTTTLKDRLVILDPSRPHYMPRLSFFDLKSDDLCFYLFKAID